MILGTAKTCLVKLVCVTPEQSREIYRSGAQDVHVHREDCVLWLGWQGDLLEDVADAELSHTLGSMVPRVWWYPGGVTPCNTTWVITYAWSRIFLAVSFLRLGLSWARREAEGRSSLTDPHLALAFLQHSSTCTTDLSLLLLLWTWEVKSTKFLLLALCLASAEVCFSSLLITLLYRPWEYKDFCSTSNDRWLWASLA